MEKLGALGSSGWNFRMKTLSVARAEFMVRASDSNNTAKGHVMNYTIIKGTFHVAKYSPDGDSVRFQALDHARWKAFTFNKASSEDDKKRQLRFEGIDALETHFGAGWHQSRAFGFAAMEVMLGLIGITEVSYNLAMTKITKAKDGTPGTIAVTGLDRYDRPISLVFAGHVASLADGAEVPFSKLPMKECVNNKLLKLGLVYPAFYNSMPVELMDLFAKETAKVRKNKTGLWALDRTRDFQMLNEDSIISDLVIYPKLFRRLVAFLEAASSYDELGPYLEAKGDDLVLRSTGAKTTFAELLEIKGRRITLAAEPEDMIFDSKA